MFNNVTFQQKTMGLWRSQWIVCFQAAYKIFSLSVENIICLWIQSFWPLMHLC